MLVHSEGTQLLHGRFVLFNPSHFSRQGSQVKVSGKVIQVFRGAYRVHLHRALRRIPHPAAESELSGLLNYEIAESDAVHASGDHPSSGFSAFQ